MHAKGSLEVALPPTSSILCCVVEHALFPHPPLHSLCGGFVGARTEAPSPYARNLLGFGVHTKAQAHTQFSLFGGLVLCSSLHVLMFPCPFPLRTNFVLWGTHLSSSFLHLHFATSSHPPGPFLPPLSCPSNVLHPNSCVGALLLLAPITLFILTSPCLLAFLPLLLDSFGA